MRKTPKIVDLFCGCGGFSLGAHRSGLAPQLAFDVDETLTSSFEQNFRGTQRVIADLSKIEASDITAKLGRNIDGIYGGPPCQAFSEIGRRREDDLRRTLLRDFFRLVSQLKPGFFVMENVRGLMLQNMRHVLDDALSLLPGRYSILGPIVLDAADFGAATQRPRVFVLGFDPDKCGVLTMRDIEAAKRAPATVGAAILDLETAELVLEENGFDYWKLKHRGRPNDYIAPLRDTAGIVSSHRRTKHTKEVISRFRKLKPGQVDKVGRHVRLDVRGQCPTLRAGTGSELGSFQSVRPIHPHEPRVITVREAARLQGFPDSFHFHPTIWHSFRMIGNSVSPVISTAIFSLIAPRLDVYLPQAAE